MGCCTSAERKKDEPMSGSQVVGREGGQPVNRDEQRERAAAAAEARATSNAHRGQQGSQSKMRQQQPTYSANHDGRVDVTTASAWN